MWRSILKFCSGVANYLKRRHLFPLLKVNWRSLVVSRPYRRDDIQKKSIKLCCVSEILSLEVFHLLFRLPSNMFIFYVWRHESSLQLWNEWNRQVSVRFGKPSSMKMVRKHGKEIKLRFEPRQKLRLLWVRRKIVLMIQSSVQQEKEVCMANHWLQNMIHRETRLLT